MVKTVMATKDLGDLVVEILEKQRTPKPAAPELRKPLEGAPERVLLWNQIIEYRETLANTLARWQAVAHAQSLTAPLRNALAQLDDELSKERGLDLTKLRKLASRSIALPYDRETLERYVHQYIDAWMALKNNKDEAKHDSLAKDIGELRSLAEYLLAEVTGMQVDLGELYSEAYRIKNCLDRTGGRAVIAKSIVDLALNLQK